MVTGGLRVNLWSGRWSRLQVNPPRQTKPLDVWQIGWMDFPLFVRRDCPARFEWWQLKPTIEGPVAPIRITQSESCREIKMDKIRSACHDFPGMPDPSKFTFAAPLHLFDKLAEGWVDQNVPRHWHRFNDRAA